MNYYVKETVFDETRNRTAASKAREDVNRIAEEMGFAPIEVNYDYGLRKRKGFAHALRALTDEWKKAFSRVSGDDAILIQFPFNHHPLRVGKMIDDAHKNGTRVILLIHDIDSLRMNRSGISGFCKYMFVRHEDRSILKRGDVVIAHNEQMISVLAKKNYCRNCKALIPLQIFDYLNFDFNARDHGERSLSNPVVIAGTLRRGKADYVYKLPDNVRFNLYGVGYEGKPKENIHYHGSFEPNELLSCMEGSLGLVWDGDSPDGCEGLAGRYLAINNPHKTSLYLAAGFPVVVWSKAAIANFVRENECGITIERLSELGNHLEALSEAEYQSMSRRAMDISSDLCYGSFTKRALTNALRALDEMTD